MLTQQQIIEYAIKGLEHEIEKHEKQIRKGYQFLEDIRKGKSVKTPKTEDEIIDIIQKHHAEIERLKNEIHELDWQRALEETGEKTLVFEKEDFDPNDPKRMKAIFEVLAALCNFDTVHVSFDYEGRTRHKIMANAFKEKLIELGYGDLKFTIGDNYEFTIEKKSK